MLGASPDPFPEGEGSIRKKTDLTSEARQICFFHLPLSTPVGVGGFEPPTTASQTRCASQLRYTPEEGEYNADVACTSSRRVMVLQDPHTAETNIPFNPGLAQSRIARTYPPSPSLREGELYTKNIAGNIFRVYFNNKVNKEGDCR